MGYLDWIERLDGWWSGPYQIELIAPRLWVLSRHDDQPDVKAGISPARIEKTAGSLSALKVSAAEMVRRRRLRTLMLRRLTILLLALLVLTASYLSSARWAPMAVIVSSAVGFFALLSVLNLLARRSWDSLRDNYQ